jgi:uncharacterized protein YlxW (UPF0749 family)
MTRLHDASAALLETLLTAGPMGVFLGGSGLIVLATIASVQTNEHTDVWAALGAVLLIGAIVHERFNHADKRAEARFREHEKVEREDRAKLLESVLAQSKNHLATMLNQVESVGAIYDAIEKRLRTTAEEVEHRGPRIASLEAAVTRIGTDVDVLKAWRERIGNRLGELK